MTDAGRGHLAMLAFSALVAGSFSLGAQIANEISPAALNAVRFWLASLVIGTAVLLQGGMTRADFAAPWRFMILGGIFGAYFVLMFEGLKTAPAVSAAAVFTLTPVMSGFFGWWLLGQVTSARMRVALAIGATGAIWVIFRADISAALAFAVGRGEMIYFVGCIAHALYTPLVAKLNRGESALVFTFGMLIAGAILLTIYAARDLMTTDWAALRPLVWITILYTSVFASAGSFYLLQFASLRLPSAKVMAYTYLTPSWVILWELALRQDRPPVLVLGGVLLTLVALWMLLKPEAAQTETLSKPT